MAEKYNLYMIRTRPDIGLPGLAVVEVFVSPDDLKAQIKAVHHSLEMVVVGRVEGPISGEAEAVARAADIAAADGTDFTLHWPPPLKHIKIETTYDGWKVDAEFASLFDRSPG